MSTLCFFNKGVHYDEFYVYALRPLCTYVPDLRCCHLYIFEKRYNVFQPLGLSVCVCVCHQDCDEMAGLSNTVLSEAITPDKSSKKLMQHYQDGPLAGSGS